MIIQAAGVDDLADYARVPISFEQHWVLDVQDVDHGLGGLRFVETRTDPVVKDYDQLEGQRPTDWPERFDLSRWSFALARDSDGVIGAAAWIIDDPDLRLLRDRRDVALLWDIRVAPAHRGRGVGTALWDHVVHDARGRRCRRLRAETQNTNIDACHFYVKRGARLVEVDRLHYVDTPKLAHEVMLIWELELM